METVEVLIIVFLAFASVEVMKAVRWLMRRYLRKKEGGDA